MSISHVSGGYQGNVTATSEPVTLASGLQGQDRIFIAQTVDPSIGTTATPTGYTLVLSVDNGANHRLLIWSKLAAGSAGSASSEAGTVVTLNNGGGATAQHAAAVAVHYRGVGAINASASLAETSNTANHTTASVVAAAANSYYVVFGSERTLTGGTGSTSVSVSNSSVETLWNKSFQGGAGPTAGIYSGDNLISATPTASGATMGGRTWTTTNANTSFISAILSLTPSGATVSAGATQTVPVNSTVTLTASESGVSGTPTRAWTQVSGPTVTLSGAATASASFTPTVADQYVFQYSLTDANGTSTSTVQVNATTTTPGPVAVISAGGWTPQGGGSPTLLSAVTDNTDSTYDQSSSVPVNDPITWRLAPAAIGTGGLTFTFNGWKTGSDKTITRTVNILDLTAGTTVATRSFALTTSTLQYTLALTASELSAITDANNLGIQLSDNAS